jgi:hypothetical protein
MFEYSNGDLGRKLAEKNNAFNVLTGGCEGNKSDAAKLFAATIPDICKLSSDNTLCLMENVKSIRNQTAEIVRAHQGDDSIMKEMHPIVEKYALSL